jgi:creatinine amidohydrolase
MGRRQMRAQPEVRWSERRWPEIDALDRNETVLLLPTGAIEQHGPHLPVDTDIHTALELSLRAAAAAAGPTLVLPPVWWGNSPHHMAFPGTLSLRVETFADLIRDLCVSVHHHGFRRVLIVNGHGGNAANLAATALRLSDEHGIFVATASYWSLVATDLRRIGTSPIGGMGHACEMETSLQLRFRPERVDTDALGAHLPHLITSFNGIDFRDAGPISYPWDFARDTVDGVLGDPTAATAEKGAEIEAAVVGQLIRFISEFRAADLVRGWPGATG